MEQINWVHVIAALLGGGAAGAVINGIVTTRRARIQPVGRRLSIIPIFRPSDDSSSINAKILVSQGEQLTAFKNLFLAEIQLINRGNRDIDSFEFGVTLGEGDYCIHVESSTLDRHHKVSSVDSVAAKSPRRELDFSLAPFNRRDSYTLRLFLVIPENSKEPASMLFSSPRAIRFVDMPSISEALVAAASGVTLRVGPIRIGIE